MGEQEIQHDERMDQQEQKGDGDVARQDGRELLEPSERESFRTRWEAIQATFVDEPKGSVEDADSLVTELMQNVERRLAEQREQLERRWTYADEASTEDLRVTLTRYRDFFDRLLSK
jgi:hypothetical protein